jgi:chemotaxis regulatin CheY-phosphate phosphatase CheZ
MSSEKYASAVAANVALEELIRLLVASKAIDEYRFHQAITDARLRLNASGDATQQAAAKALSELYNSRAGG